MWVNNFQTPKIQAVLTKYFREGNDIACVVIGVVGGLNIGVQRRLKARSPVWGPTAPSLCS